MANGFDQGIQRSSGGGGAVTGGAAIGTILGGPVGAGIGAGLGALAERLFARGFDRERIERLIGRLRSQMGEDVIDTGEQGRLVEQAFTAGGDRRQKLFQGISNRLGLDSGLAQKEIGRSLVGDRARAELGVSQQNLNLTSQRNTNFENLIARLEQDIARG